MRGNANYRCARLLGMIALCLAACAVMGCKSASIGRYVSPRITGRVIDESTHLPVEGVAVRRLTSNSSFRPMEAPKGGQLLMEPPVVRTGHDGSFILESVRDLSLFGRGWYSVSLSFQHPDYQESIAYYTIADATNSPHDVPTVNAGDVLLLPSAKKLPVETRGH